MPRRTTITLDDDVAQQLDDEARAEQRPFEAIVNETLRRGLGTDKQRFEVKAKAMGVRSDLNLDSIEELLDQVENPDRR